MTVNQLVKIQHENGEETEFYPTTQDMVDCVAKWISENGMDTYSVLDIGCGNGSFFEKLDKTEWFYTNEYKSKNSKSKLHQNYKKCGIEKSYILAEQMPDDIILLGSDFDNNTLIDKKVDCIFCNPPYSEYEKWAERIISEGNAEKVVLVIPQRWRDSEKINIALEKRKLKANVIGSFDFHHAERKARAVVDVIGIMPDSECLCGHRYVKEITDPFDIWFDSTFTLKAEKQKEGEYEKRDKRRSEIMQLGDTAENLVQFYNADMQKLYDNYRALENLDADIFRELKVDVGMLKKSLKERLKGLKHLYWDLLFKKYDKLMNRLTTAGKKVLSRLNDNTVIDFTMENIFMLTMWIIRHSNTLFDEQLTDFFFKLARSESIHRYKSNLRWNDSDWRYLKEDCRTGSWKQWNENVEREKLRNVMLDYRIVVSDYSNFDTDWYKQRMTDSCRDFLYDMKVIAANLGYNLNLNIPERYTDTDVSQWSNCNIYTEEGELFCNLKLYKNGNRHIKFCQPFMQKLNVEMARINGWVHSKEEAKEELGLSEQEINQFWNNNMKIGVGEGRKLLGLPEAV